MLPAVALPPSTIPSRPPMPTAEDMIRAERQTNRWAIMTDDFEPLLEAWLIPIIGEERVAQWGKGDTSANVLGDICRQFSTPGLYGSRPTVRHSDPGTAGLTEPGGELDRAGFFTMMQTGQYLTMGMGDLPIYVDCSADEGLSFQIVPPADVWVWSTQAKPDVPRILWWLRLYPLGTGEDTTWVYVWEQYDLGDRGGAGSPARPPSFRVVAATGATKGADVTDQLFTDMPPGGFIGENYRWKRADGKPFLPWVIYRVVDSKKRWNVTHMLGATKGALNAASNWTYANHCARDASGTAVIAAGLNPIMGNLQNAGQADKIQTVAIAPGSILYHSVQEGAQPFVQEVGPGGNLAEVSAYAHGYEARQLVRFGLSAEDVEKSSADPASGAALYISNEAKRKRADMMRPLFERGDLEMLGICAALLRICGLGDYPETGYSIDYARIPRSPAEMQADREQTDWELQHEHISEIEAYQRAHPGVTEEDAIAALTKTALDRARLEAAKAAALAAAGLQPKTDAGTTKVELTATDVASIVNVNQALQSVGLPPLDGPDGLLTVAEYQAKNAATIAAANAATSGQEAPPPPAPPAP